jgi:hypothetical protein
MKTRILATLICLALVAGIAAAMDEPLSGRAAATLEGTWIVQVTLRHCDSWAPLGQPFPAYASFNAAGTVITSDGGMSPAARGAGHGVWHRLGRGHYAATVEAFLFNDGVRSGTQRLVQEIALQGDGRRFESTIGAAMLNASGQVIFSGCASSVGQRMD